MDSVRSRVMHKLQVLQECTAQGPQGGTAGPGDIFLAALETGDLDLVQLLGARHANTVFEVRGQEMGYQAQTSARFGLAGLWTLEYTQELTSPLCITCARGHTECVRYLLHRRADPRAAPGGRSPLHEACAGGHGDCVQLLLEHGANPNQLSTDGVTPLHLCDTRSSLRYRHSIGYSPGSIIIQGSHCPETAYSLSADNPTPAVPGLVTVGVLCAVQVLRCCSAAPEVIALLYNSYTDLRVCESWKVEVPDDVFQTHLSFYTTFFSLPGAVRSLQHLCRSTLRRQFGSRCHRLVPLLPVPSTVQDYLLMHSAGSLL
ncbi:LOW QUALITY PROTEIN: ankyrin repeat and SOCS box protein 18 [Ascaphus truei]|uniref:LOW QUALITY PROTEIN: ankyrin repeat and SOCS box protein 18 n=1 Tax=Ascaphus truei TaxID=8439 RepID=UPI003F59DF30